MKVTCLLAAFTVTALGKAEAGIIGSLGLADTDGVTVGAGTLDNISTSDVFNFLDLQTTDGGTGIYAGIPATSIGPVSFDVTDPTGLTINYGGTTFQSTSVIVERPNSTNVLVNYTGMLSGGGTNPDPIEALLNFSFSQVGGPGTTITGSGTLVVNSTPIPEPSTVVMASLGLLGLVPFVRRRQKHLTNKSRLQ